MTGNWRDSTLITGGVVLKRRGFSVKSSSLRVADMTTSFRGLPRLFLRGTIRDKRPIKMSVYTLLSCASSSMIMEYLDSRKSCKSKGNIHYTVASRCVAEVLQFLNIISHHFYASLTPIYRFVMLNVMSNNIKELSLYTIR